MADAEESPSSLAELEALAGLEGAHARDEDEHADDHDVGAFDLASLAASQAVVGETSDTDAPAGTDALDPVLPTAVATNGVAATPAVAPSRGPRGFALGLVAGVAVAAVVFALMNYGSPVGESAREAAVSSASPVLDEQRSLSPSMAAAPVVVPVAAAPPAPGIEPVLSKSPRAGTVSRSSSEPATAARAGRGAPSGVDAHEDPTRPPAVPAPVEPAAPGRPIDSLLDEALAPNSRAKVKRAPDADLMGAELPLAPTAADVTKVIQVMLPAIRGCAMGQSGVANTLLVVRADGGVASASITGAPYAGAASGQCMEGVLRRAKFPRFRQSVFRVQFPLSIRASSP